MYADLHYTLHLYVMYITVLEQTAQQLAGGRPMEEVIAGWGNASTGYGGCVSRSGRGRNQALLHLLVDKYVHLMVCVDEYS